MSAVVCYIKNMFLMITCKTRNYNKHFSRRHR